jgi:UDP-N-acetylglucosamine--N-acetylmuramyl-(pentapeptide) pyrophosphoryl-undecaprenol N-acetylglucosamine transferase
MGGYVAGPPVLAAILRGVPLVIMEPNAVPGFTNRHIARWVKRALLSFEETRRFFPEGRTEVTGRPVKQEFFDLPPKPRCEEFTVLITGGSQGSQTLNRAAQEAWPMFVESGLPVRFIHQSGRPMHDQLAAEFARTGLRGEINAFIADMPGAFAEADLIVCRSGGTVSELAAAGKPSVLIPFPFAADQHQLKNAEAFERAGAARMFLDRDWTGLRFFETSFIRIARRSKRWASARACWRSPAPRGARLRFWWNAHIVGQKHEKPIDRPVSTRNNK